MWTLSQKEQFLATNKQIKQSYDYNSSLIKTKEMNDRYFKQFSITFTKRCFMSSVFDTGPVILENLFEFHNRCYLPLD